MSPAITHGACPTCSAEMEMIPCPDNKPGCCVLHLRCPICRMSDNRPPSSESPAAQRALDAPRERYYAQQWSAAPSHGPAVGILPWSVFDRSNGYCICDCGDSDRAGSIAAALNSAERKP